MGSTIRRQPLSFKIPASPDYQFLNVLNFNGLNMTDNPFNADVTTASDCLNVYVDEANALTTRPRLELFHSLKNRHPRLTKLIGCYPLSIGFLFYYKEDGSYAFDIAYEVGNTLSFVDVDTKANPKVDSSLSVFEQNDKIYILSGEGYYFITYTIIDDIIVRAEIDNVEGYIPTTRVGKNKQYYDEETDTYKINVDGTQFEQLNILSDKYKESYFWDGSWNPNDLISAEEDVLTNNYFSQKEYKMNDYLFIKKLTSRKISNGFVQLVKRISDDVFGFLTVYNNGSVGTFTQITEPTTNLISSHPLHKYIDSNSDGTFITIAYCVDKSNPEGYDTSATGGVFVGRSTGTSYSWIKLPTGSENTFSCDRLYDVKYSRVKISENGNIVVSYSDENVILGIYKENSNTYEILTDTINMSGNDMFQGIIGNESLNVFSIGLTRKLYASNVCETIYRYKNITKDTTSLTHTLTTALTINDILISQDGNKYIELGPIYVFYWEDYLNNDTKEIVSYTKPDNFLTYDRVITSHESDKAWIVWSTQPMYVEGAWRNTQKIGLLNLRNIKDIFWDLYNISIFDANLTQIQPGTVPIASDNEISFADSIGDYFYNIRIDYMSNEPLLTIEKKLQHTDDVYFNWYEKRENFFKSFLTTRFNNERWFAGGNRLYYTTYNNPTYISLYNYNDLGESDENITGFNLADDSTLIVYKDNRVHSVKYGEVGENVYTYVYSDSPNTVGNNAFGGSIVSILTEMPLQISYDGIYALRQLTNVQSSGRISELISEGINKKWLKESKEIIKNCKTINRLYWTYFILSEKDYSKIYLLDNRTQSWYYWELPISILNAFVKNNTTYFSDTEGNLYTLKTTDLFNKFNPEITEYYDEGKKLIKWNWKSQILPMKTINYSKKLVSTTFIMSDTDEKDEYGLNYKFKAFRKTASQTQETTLTNNINYIVSTTKRTLVPRFNFMQIELSNIEGTSDDFDHNKLRLIGLAFKYVLLEGLV